MVTILETLMRSYVLWRRFWKTRMPPSSVVGLQCLNISRPSTQMTREAMLKNNEKLSWFSEFFVKLKTFWTIVVLLPEISTGKSWILLWLSKGAFPKMFPWESWILVLLTKSAFYINLFWRKSKSSVVVKRFFQKYLQEKIEFCFRENVLLSEISPVESQILSKSKIASWNFFI